MVNSKFGISKKKNPNYPKKVAAPSSRYSSPVNSLCLLRFTLPYGRQIHPHSSINSLLLLRFSLPSGRQIHPHSPINSLLLLGFTLPSGRQIHPQNRRPNTFLLHQNLCFIVALLLATPPSSPIAKYQDLRCRDASFISSLDCIGLCLRLNLSYSIVQSSQCWFICYFLKLIRLCLVFPLAFGKHHGFCARVGIGQALLSVRCKDNNSQHAQEALRRAMFKFPGRQKIIVSRKWGFTKFNRADCVKLKQENRIMPNGVNAKLLECRGPLANRQPR